MYHRFDENKYPSTNIQINIFKNQLGDGNSLGIKISYEIQNKPNGIPEAFLISENFINNEEVLLMLMKIALKKSNYSKVKKLSQTFVKVCDELCDENNQIQESLKNIEPKNES